MSAPTFSRSPRAAAYAAAGLVFAAALLTGSTAHAEAGWLTSRGRLLPQTRLEAWGGPRSVGVGLVRPDGVGASAGWGVETLYTFPDRVLELRGTRQWQFSKTRAATGSATLELSSFIVPVGDFDLGIGPHAGLNLGVGGGFFTIDFGLQSGLELFVRQDAPRFPQRALIGFNFQLGEVAVSAMARGGGLHPRALLRGARGVHRLAGLAGPRPDLEAARAAASSAAARAARRRAGPRERARRDALTRGAAFRQLASASTSFGTSFAATLHKATRKAPFCGTTYTPFSRIFWAWPSASGWNTVTKKPPS